MVARLVALFQSLTVINEEFVTDNKQYFYIWFNLTVQATNSVQVCQFCSKKNCVHHAAFYLYMYNTAFMYYIFIDNVRIVERENRVICVFMDGERERELSLIHI